MSSKKINVVVLESCVADGQFLKPDKDDKPVEVTESTAKALVHFGRVELFEKSKSDSKIKKPRE